MQAARYTLRFVTGIGVGGATYGSDDYGKQTYGQRATDVLNAYRYYVVPLPAGYPTTPSWIIRQGDIRPNMQAQILTADEAATPLDLTAVASAFFVMSAVDGGDEPAWVVDAIPQNPRTKGILAHAWQGHIPPGVYRVLIVMRMQSGRRFTLPTNDGLRLRVTEVLGSA